MTTIIDPTDNRAEAIERLLTCLETAPTDAAAIASRSAVKRHGRELARAGGVTAMRVVLEQVAVTSHTRRLAILECWEGIPGWHLGAAA